MQQGHNALVVAKCAGVAPYFSGVYQIGDV
jgi:hypothetical protein